MILAIGLHYIVLLLTERLANINIAV